MKKIATAFYLFILFNPVNAQYWAPFTVSNMPMPISNNAVTEGWANDTGYVFSFGGIDSTKIWSGITNKSFRYNTKSDIWDTIPNLPNPNAVIAAGASYVDSLIYIIGGYRVLSNGNEISSNIVNRFDPRTNTYLSNGANIPLAIDDHVQAVYKDSLIYLITGWSNTGNASNVQIYDPTNDNWLTGTPVPNNNSYKAFGASGLIVEDTIYYHGGASTGTNFPGQSVLRKGYINPSNPTSITWTDINTTEVSYRAVATYYEDYDIVYWLGGSSTTYNYNGIAYNGASGVEPRTSTIQYYPYNSSSFTEQMNLPMDLRGIANLSNNVRYIAGGMLDNQIVSNKTYLLAYRTVGIKGISKATTFQLYPNPTSEQANLIFKKKEKKIISLIDLMGKEIFTTSNNTLKLQLDVSSYPKGIYFIKVTTESESSSQKIVIQ